MLRGRLNVLLLGLMKRYDRVVVLAENTIIWNTGVPPPQFAALRQFLSNVKVMDGPARPGWGTDLVFAAGGNRDLHSRQRSNRDEATTSR